MKKRTKQTKRLISRAQSNTPSSYGILRVKAWDSVGATLQKIIFFKANETIFKEEIYDPFKKPILGP